MRSEVFFSSARAIEWRGRETPICYELVNQGKASAEVLRGGPFAPMTDQTDPSDSLKASDANCGQLNKSRRGS